MNIHRLISALTVLWAMTAQGQTGHITFTDSLVENVCVTHWDSDGDGRLSHGEARRITSFGHAFTSNKYLSEFPEMQFFTGMTCVNDSAFLDCFGIGSFTPKRP